MAKKKPETPDGMICSRCGQDKTPHNFFKFMGKFDRDFFVSGIPAKSDVCWDCLGGMKCIECGGVYPSTEFKVNGRVCRTCKNAPPREIMPTNSVLDDKEAV